MIIQKITIVERDKEREVDFQDTPVLYRVKYILTLLTKMLKKNDEG